MGIIRSWGLIISIVTGIVGYVVYASIPWLEPTYHWVSHAVSVVQPLLIFAMLYLTFCRISPRQIRLCRWHLWLLLIQGGVFSLTGLLLILMPESPWRVVLEGLMICVICPTATAAPVITRKLGGDIAHIMTYTILINLLASLLIPALVPYVHPQPGMSSVNASMLIMGKVFPVLLLPLILAALTRRLTPRLCHRLVSAQDAPFYIWLVSLSMSIEVTTHSILTSSVDLSTQLWLVGVSLTTCVAQFWAGRRIGSIYGDTVTAGQALGQKNTVFGMWVGYTFFSPVTSVVEGFYSIWHNVINSWQLYRQGRGQ